MEPTKLIQLADGVLLEVAVQPNEVPQPIAGGLAEKVNSTFEAIQPVLIKTCRPIIAAWGELSKEIHIDQAEIELGLSFEGEGNLYITKTKASANLSLKLIIKTPLP